MAEKRLIDAMKTVIKLSGRIMPLIQMGANTTQVYNEVLQVVAEAPTADAVEVVRCKDCRHWDSETGWCNNHSAFDDHDMDWNIYNDDDFCSCGERRTDG